MFKVAGWTFLMLLMLHEGASAELWRRTTTDAYSESLETQWREQRMGQSEAQVRAEAYRAMCAY